MAVTVMNTTYRKFHFKYFCNNSFKESFRKAFSQNLGVGCNEIYEIFADVCNKILDNHALLKKKCVKGYHSPFINKYLSKPKAIIVRTRLWNIFLKNGSEENEIN